MPAFTDELSLLAAFMIGLLGSPHCVGMCGGITGSLAMGLDAPLRQPRRLLPWLLTYNAGRLLSYTLAGLLAGVLAAQTRRFFHLGDFPWGGLIGGLFMLALGLYVAGWFQALAPLERAGGRLWRRIEPLGRRFMPVRSPLQAFALGVVWGWLPCGLVYSALAWSATSASPGYAASLMLAFGLGTLPMLLLMGVFARQLQAFVQQPLVRQFAGALLIAFALLLFYRVFFGAHHHAGPMPPMHRHDAAALLLSTAVA